MDNKQSNFANESKNFDKGTRTIDIVFLIIIKLLGLLFTAREQCLFWKNY